MLTFRRIGFRGLGWQPFSPALGHCSVSAKESTKRFPPKQSKCGLTEPFGRIIGAIAAWAMHGKGDLHHGTTCERMSESPIQDVSDTAFMVAAWRAREMERADRLNKTGTTVMTINTIAASFRIRKTTGVGFSIP